MSATAAAQVAEARAVLDAMFAPGTRDAEDRAVEQYASPWPLPRHTLSAPAEQFAANDVAAVRAMPYAAVRYASTALQWAAKPERVAAALADACAADPVGTAGLLPVCACCLAPQTGFITGPDGAAVGWFHDQAEAAAYVKARGVAA